MSQRIQLDTVVLGNIAMRRSNTETSEKRDFRLLLPLGLTRVNASSDNVFVISRSTLFRNCVGSFGGTKVFLLGGTIDVNRRRLEVRPASVALQLAPRELHLMYLDFYL